MKVKPIGNRVLLKVLMSDEKTSGGIYIPASAQEKTQEGIIQAMGEVDNEIKDKVQVGQRVVYEKYAGTQIKIEEQEHLLLKVEDILAIVQ